MSLLHHALVTLLGHTIPVKPQSTRWSGAYPSLRLNWRHLQRLTQIINVQYILSAWDTYLPAIINDASGSARAYRCSRSTLRWNTLQNTQRVEAITA
jgi:hypothetical protein